MNPRTFLVLTFLICAVALTAHAQTLSPDGSSITPTSGGSIVTSAGTWTFGSQSDANGTNVLLNGNSSIVWAVELLISGGQLYQENAQGAWYVYQNGQWPSTSARQTASSGGTTSASNPCTNYYQSGTAIPSGYGAAYDGFSSQHELLVNVDCSGSSPVLKVGSGSSSQYVYNKGYLYQSGSWQSINLTGTGLVSNAWYSKIAQASLNITPSSWTYVVGYVCFWNGSAWQCGCADTSCTTNYWQLQAFIVQTSASGGSVVDTANCPAPAAAVV